MNEQELKTPYVAEARIEVTLKGKTYLAFAAFGGDIDVYERGIDPLGTPHWRPLENSNQWTRNEALALAFLSLASGRSEVAPEYTTANPATALGEWESPDDEEAEMEAVG